MMDEKWLHGKIIDACDEYAGGHLTTERVLAIADAYAHAIAEELQKGVVWTDYAYAGQGGPVLVSLRLRDDQRGIAVDVSFYGEDAQQFRGKQLRVTVKEEGDGQGMA